MPQTTTDLTPQERVNQAMEAFKIFEARMEELMQEERDLVQKTIKEAEDSKIKEVLGSIMQIYDRHPNAGTKP